MKTYYCKKCGDVIVQKAVALESIESGGVYWTHESGSGLKIHRRECLVGMGYFAEPE